MPIVSLMSLATSRTPILKKERYSVLYKDRVLWTCSLGRLDKVTVVDRLEKYDSQETVLVEDNKRNEG